MSYNIQLMLADFNQKLRIDPHNPDVYNNIACLYYRINQIDDAIYYYKRAISINPNNCGWHFNLANCYVKKNLIPDAIAHYQNSIQLNPENIDAIQNLGMLLIDMQNFTEALPYLEKSYNLNKENQTHFEFIEQLANCYLQLGNITKAIEYLQLATNIHPTKESAQHNLAILYLREKNHELAARHFKLVLELNPQNYTAKHMLDSLSVTQRSQKSNTATMLQPPLEYIANLFDQYASYYNSHLTEKLQYNLPTKFRNLYAKHKTTISAQNALDLGCGTGLCGIYFRDACVNLIGVDISKNMLLEARKNNFYDLLIKSNLQDKNIFKENYFDLIIAADVLPYFGELENIFLNIKNILNKNNSNVNNLSNINNLKNIFLFNIELIKSQSNLDFLLQPTGRYAHSVSYIEKLAKQFDFLILENITGTIRLQDDQAVVGELFVLTRT